MGALAGAVGSIILTRMRAAGLEKVDDLVREAMLHPEVARVLLSKTASRAQGERLGRILAERLQKLMPISAAQQE
jgi:hypothetical protein